jgi:hypothetical protein
LGTLLEQWFSKKKELEASNNRPENHLLFHETCTDATNVFLEMIRTHGSLILILFTELEPTIL